MRAHTLGSEAGLLPRMLPSAERVLQILCVLAETKPWVTRKGVLFGVVGFYFYSFIIMSHLHTQP